MTTVVKRYLRAVNCSLPCEGAPKRRLMELFRASLSDFLDETPEPDMLTLHQAFGSPNEMANVLANDLTSNEIQNSRRVRCVRRGLIWSSIIVSVVLFTLLIHSIYFTIKPITITEQIIVGDSSDYPYDFNYPSGN